MSKIKSRSKFLILILLAASVASIVTFSHRNQRTLYQTPIDFLIFLHAGESYKESGQLYLRSENYADAYHPSAAIYKFPPAFQLIIKPFLYLPEDGSSQVFMRLLFTGIYILSLCLLFFYIRHHFKLKGLQLFYFATTLGIVSCWFMPFFESVRWLLAEIPLLLIFVLSFILLSKPRLPAAISGALMAFAACIKIYPAFLFAYHLLQKKRAAYAGFIIGLGITLAISVMLFGIAEHIFYIKNILPVLLHEPITEKWVNLNLEKFLFITGFIPEVTGKVFTITRILFVSGMLGIVFIYRAIAQKNELMFFAFFITTMFFCFPNYWPQYQIFLIIPIAYLAANAIKHHDRTTLTLLFLAISPLFIPDLLWQQVLAWDALRHGLDIEIIGRESYLNGAGITLLKYSPCTWAVYYLYEYRAVTPVILWILQALQIIKHSRT
jgi:hypothetical protein